MNRDLTIPPCPRGCDADWIVSLEGTTWGCLRCGSKWQGRRAWLCYDPWIIPSTFDRLHIALMSEAERIAARNQETGIRR